MTTLTQKIASFVFGLNLRDLPVEVAAKARVCLVNSYGIALGSYTSPYASPARACSLALHGEVPKGATLLGDGRKTSIIGAAFANSALFHGRVQDDTSGAAHIASIVLPAITALLEVKHFPLDRLLPAFVAAYEVGGLLEKAYSSLTTPAGFRASPLYGSFAAAAAVARLMNLSEDRIAAALAHAASFTGGILQSFDDGSDEWRYQLGAAAANGLFAAQLAASGSKGALRALEGKTGFVRCFARADCDVDAIGARLGKEWSIKGVMFKPYPVCAFNQTPVIAALALRDRLQGKGMRSVRVRMNPYEACYAGMDSKGPFSSVSGTLMSIPFCIAATLIRGAPTMKMIGTYDDAAVNDLIQRIELVPDASVARLSCAIDITLDDGEKIVHQQIMTANDYDLDMDGISSLVRRIGAETGVPAAAYDKIIGFARNLPAGSVDDVLGAFSLLPASDDQARQTG